MDTTRSYRKPVGLISKATLAEMCGVTQPTVQYWIRAGHIAPPTHQTACGTRLYYTDEEAAEIARLRKL